MSINDISGTALGNMPVNMYDEIHVVIDNIEDFPDGRGPKPVIPIGSIEDPIRFFDYDGTLVASYKVPPDSLPKNPQHKGLVAQGWNYTLEEVEEQFLAMGTCDVGQMYITESGDTEIDVIMLDGRLSPYLTLGINGEVEINWDDESSVDTITGTSIGTNLYIPHVYATSGHYTIKIHVKSGEAAIRSEYAKPFMHGNFSSASYNRVYGNCIKAVRLGDSMKFQGYGLSNCYHLETLTIPYTLDDIAGSTFGSCARLKFVTIPKGVTIIRSSTFASTFSVIISLPVGITTIDRYAFENSLISFISLPYTINTISMYAFKNCGYLRNISIPQGITLLDSDIFSTCSSLASITIPKSVSSIYARAFENCYGLGEIKFKRATPPTASSNVWSNLPTNCKIYVPAGSLEAYTTAANYPSSSTYTYIEESSDIPK